MTIIYYTIKDNSSSDKEKNTPGTKPNNNKGEDIKSRIIVSGVKRKVSFQSS